MRITIHRIKTSVFWMYLASISIDGEKILRLPNGADGAADVPPGGRFLQVRTGPYMSAPFDLSNVKAGATLQIAPRVRFGAGGALILGVAALAMSRAFDGTALLILLALAIVFDLLFLREKWTIKVINP